MDIQQVTLVANVAAGSMRKDTLEGRDHIVVGVVMMTEGVRNGSKGPIFYSDKFLRQTPEAWNHMPILVGHPVTGSAMTPQVLNASKIGILLNSQYRGDGKRRWFGEAWLDIERMLRVDSRISRAIANGYPVEVSTGLTLTTEQLEVPAEYDGVVFNTVAVSYLPDHLAVLPDETGACSCNDGCGLTKNHEGDGMVVLNHQKPITETPLLLPVMNFDKTESEQQEQVANQQPKQEAPLPLPTMVF